MQDTAIPSFANVGNSTPAFAFVNNTQAAVFDQGLTYNQANLTYNQSQVIYAGLINTNQDVIPQVLNGQEVIPQNLSSTTLSPNLETASNSFVGVTMVFMDSLKLNVAQDAPSGITALASNSTIYNQNIAYNQANLTYNQSGIAYQGLYNINEDLLPLLIEAITLFPSITIPVDTLDLVLPNTQALVYDQGYSYNQSGLTYNQTAVAYGGIYGADEDTVAQTLTFSDIYLANGKKGNESVGPGWFMLITVP